MQHHRPTPHMICKFGETCPDFAPIDACPWLRYSGTGHGFYLRQNINTRYDEMDAERYKAQNYHELDSKPNSFDKEICLCHWFWALLRQQQLIRQIATLQCLLTEPFLTMPPSRSCSLLCPSRLSLPGFLILQVCLIIAR